MSLRFLAVVSLFVSAGCLPLEGAGDVSGDYSVDYEGTWTIYEEGEPIAEIVPGEGEEVALVEGVFVFDVLCARDDRQCPEEALWGAVSIDHPIPDVFATIEITNEDELVGEPGARLAGVVSAGGDFKAFAGADPRCEEPAIGAVAGQFTAEGIEEGTVGWDYPAGCDLDGLVLAAPIRIEAPFVALRLEADKAAP